MSFVFVFLGFNAVTAADGDIIYVSPSGSDANDGLTWETAKRTIKNATGTVNSGGTVIIADGTYSGSGNSAVIITKNMTIEGSSRDGTILSGLDLARIFTVNSGCTVNIEDLTITNGKSAYGGGILNMGALTVNNCKFTKCTTYNLFMGGGSAISSSDYSTLTVRDSVFTGNDASSSYTAGGTICTNGATNIENCDFINNYAHAGTAIYMLGGNLNANNCRFIGNTAVDYGGALAIYTANAAVNIHNSAFINNVAESVTSTNNIDNGLYSFLNITDNWWGSNEGPTGIGGSINDASSWIYMNSSVNSSTTQYGGNISVKTDFDNIYDNNSKTVSSKDVGWILDGYNNMVYFSSDLGTLNPAHAEINSGVANSIFTADSIGTGNITATFNSQTLKNSITVDKAVTALSTNDTSGYNGRTVNLTAKLSTQDGNSISGKNVTFKVNGTDLGSAVTDPDGIATLEYNVTQTQGTYNITADFTGDDTYLASTCNGTLTVNVLSTGITVSNISAFNGRTVNLTANLTDENGYPVADKTVVFSLNGNIVGNATTNNDGTAVLSYKLNTSGTYPVTASFSGDYVYVNCTGAGIANIAPAAYLYLNSKSSKNDLTVGDKFIIIYKLGNKGPDTAQNVTVTFKVPKGLQFENIIVDNGNWTYNKATRTVTWILNSVEVGDPYLFLSVKSVSAGNYKINPTITSATYNENTGGKGAITINVKSQSNNGNSTIINALSTTGMQKTGLPINYMILAVLMVLGGLVVTKRR